MGGTWSNITTSALTYATFDTAMINMQTLLDEFGKVKGVFPDTLMVGPKLRKVASEVTGADELISVSNAGALRATSSVVAAAKLPNVYGGGMINVVLNPRLQGTQDDYWYLLKSDSRVKPIQGYIFREPESFSKLEMDDRHRLENDEFTFDIESDCVFGAGDPHAIYGGIL